MEEGHAQGPGGRASRRPPEQALQLPAEAAASAKRRYINITKVNGPEREKININYLRLKSCLLWQLEEKFNAEPEENQA